MNVKQFKFPSYEDWKASNCEYVADVLDFRVKIAVTARGCNGNPENTYEIAMSIYDNPTNIYTPKIFHENLNCRYDDDEKKRAWYESVTQRANDCLRDRILSYLAIVEIDTTSIDEQVEDLRETSDGIDTYDDMSEYSGLSISIMLDEAADTIESLSAKLESTNMEHEIFDEILMKIREKAQELSNRHWGDDERHLVGKGIQCMCLQAENIIKSNMKCSVEV